MDELDSIRVFMTVVDQGSFSAAARALNKSASSVARQIGWLEEDLGVRLLNRNTRSQSLTEAGRLYYDRVTAISRDLTATKLATRSAHEGVEGLLRIALRTSMATTVVVPALADFLERHPGLELEIEVTDDRKDLVGNNIDLAIWVGELPDSDLVARRLSINRRILCAAPAYLERAGTPQTPEELRDHNCLIFRKRIFGPNWRLCHESGTEVEIPVRGTITSENGMVLLTAALGGQGLIVVQEWMVQDLLRDGRLRRVLPDYSVGPTMTHASLYVVFPGSRRMSRRVRVFVDFLVALFERDKDRRQGDGPA